MAARVALIQNRVQRGGRFQVTSEMVRVLNENGIVPDFICFKNRIDLPEIKRVYGSNLELRFINIPEPKLPFEWNILYFNKAVQKHLKGYDLVINSNNTSYLLKYEGKLLSYVHFPRKYRLLSPLKSIHFPEGTKKSISDLANDPLKFLHSYYRKDKGILSNDRHVFNSRFTASCFNESYSLDQQDVIYPPVNEADEPVAPTSKGFHRHVVSMGRYSADKRQLEQIEVASLLPDWNFTIIGFVNEPKYFARCQERIKELGISNVELLRDASVEDRDKALDSASFFIHNLRNEPFGITTIQGLANACLPIVHDSGGQKEIIPNEDQRFNSPQQAADLLNKWWQKGEEAHKERVTELQKDLPLYTAVHFRKKFAALLDEML